MPSINPILEKILNSNHKGIKSEKLIAYKDFSSKVIESNNNRQGFAYSIEEVVCDNDIYYFVETIHYGSDDVNDSSYLVDSLDEAYKIIK